MRTKTVGERLIYQVNENLEIIGTWKSVKDINKSADFCYITRSSFDQALRKLIRGAGYYWIFKHQWDRGVRPNLNKQKRNIRVYAYKEGTGFMGRFKNSVEVSDILDISVSNVREVLWGHKKIHKGYSFSYSSLRPEEDLISDIKDIIIDIENSYNSFRTEELKVKLDKAERELIKFREEQLGIE